MAVNQRRNQCEAKSYIFRVVIEDDHFEDGREAYHAFAPALKGCHTWGNTYQEALANIREAVEIYVEDLLESGESIPIDNDQDVMVQSTPVVVVNV
jgi:predicted RNase H-like HicB family nuclease